MRCHWVQERLLIYLAGEMDAREAAKLCRHLEKCAHCTTMAEALAETQETVEGVLRPPVATPPMLHARVMDAVEALPPRARCFSWPAFWPAFAGRQRLALASAALCFLVVGFLLGHGWIGRGQTPVAQQRVLATPALARLASDHRQPLPADPHPALSAAADPSDVARAMTPRVAFPVRPVDLSREGARLLGAHKTVVQNVPVAVLSYEWQGRRLSLFQTDHRRLTVAGLHEMMQQGECYLLGKRNGLGYIIWCSGDTDMVLMAEASPEQLLRLASRAGGANFRG